MLMVGVAGAAVAAVADTNFGFNGPVGLSEPMANWRFPPAGLRSSESSER